MCSRAGASGGALVDDLAGKGRQGRLSEVREQQRADPERILASEGELNQVKDRQSALMMGLTAFNVIVLHVRRGCRRDDRVRTIQDAKTSVVLVPLVAQIPIALEEDRRAVRRDAG